MWRQKGFVNKLISELERARDEQILTTCQVTLTSDLFALCGMRTHIRHAMLRFGRGGTEKPQGRRACAPIVRQGVSPETARA